jgi:hypothetical protein
MVGRGACGRVAAHEFARTIHLTTSGEFAMGVIPPMEKRAHVCGGMWTGRSLGHEGKGGVLLGPKGSCRPRGVGEAW